MAGVRVGAVYSETVVPETRELTWSQRFGGITRPSEYRRTAVLPSLAFSAETALTERLGISVEMGYAPVEMATSAPVVITNRFVTLAPRVSFQAAGGRVRPRAYAGVTGGMAVLVQGVKTVDAPASQGRAFVDVGRGRALRAATAGVGVAVPLGDGGVRDLRVDLEGSAGTLGSDFRYRSAGFRVGVTFVPPARRR